MFLHTCVCVCAYICSCVCIYLCSMYACGCQKTTMGVILAHRNSHLIHQVGQTGWLASSKRFSCLHLPRAGPASTCHHSGLFHRFWESNSGPCRAGTLETELSPSAYPWSLLLDYTAVQLWLVPSYCLPRDYTSPTLPAGYASLILFMFLPTDISNPQLRTEIENELIIL